MILVLNILLVNAGDVAYVLKNPRNPNHDFMNSFEDLNLSVDLIKSNKVKDINYNNYKLIFVGNERFDNAKDILTYKQNSLIVNSFHLNEWGLTNDDISQIASNSPLKVKKRNKILTVYNRCCFSNNVGLPMYYLFSLNKDDDVNNIASTTINNEDSVVGFIKKESKLSNGKLSEGKISFFGITETNFWTNEARKLFKETIISLTENLDKDKDGFNEDVDCNDNDKNVNPISFEIPNNDIDENCDGIKLIIDNDYDEFNSNLDCNDNDKNINPGAVEIPNNNIDENCDGQDLIINIPNRNQTLSTEIEVLLIRNKDNKLIKDEKFYFGENTYFNKPEDFSINYKLENNLETGFYDIVLLGKSNDQMCLLNNDVTKSRFTIFVTGENK